MKKAKPIYQESKQTEEIKYVVTYLEYWDSKDKNPIRKYIYETDYSPYGDKEIKPFDDYWYFRTKEDAERKATWLRNLMTEKKWTKRIIRSIQVVEVRKVITEAIIIEAPAGEIQKKEAEK